MGKSVSKVKSVADGKVAAITKIVLKDVKPSDLERKSVLARINQIMGRLKEAAPKNVEIVVAGSFARSTNLRGDSDVDIFLLFERKVVKEEMEKKALAIAEDVVKGHKNESFSIKYAEHPYVRLQLNDIGLNVDVVPAYKIRSADEMGTSVDRTQLHNKFVTSKLTNSQRDDVLVLKAFLKSHKIYGANARVEGFSGYLCELMIINFGSFAGMLEAAANARLPFAIVVGEKIDPTASKILVDRFKKQFVVIDPTDKDRNVAANVSEESFARFVVVCRNFAASPSKETFFGKGHSEERSMSKLNDARKKIGTELYAIHFKVEDISEEIIWQQLRRLMNRLNEALLKRGFPPVLSVQEVDGTDAIIGIFVADSKIPYMVSKGPSVMMKSAAESFYKAHKNSILFTFEGDRIYAIEKTKLATPMDVLKAELSSNDKLPSYFSIKKMKIYANAMDEGYAKMLYRSYAIKIGL